MSESWSKIRKILEQDRLCLKLRGRVRYYYTLYRKSHDQAALFEVKVDEKAYFRATPFNEAHYDEVFDKLRVDWGVEQWASWDEYETEYEYLDKEAELRTAQDGIVDSYLIPNYIQRYLNQSITESLNDENAVVRMFAILDRRAGKHTLAKIALDTGSQPAWLQKFYRLRLDSEGIRNVTLVPLSYDDREQFILDNQEAFRYGALEEFGLRDDHFEEDGEIISRKTIEQSIDGGKAYRIMQNDQPVGGVVIKVDGDHGELELLFVSPRAHSKGIGYAAWCEVERLHPEVKVWETVTPYFEKRNVHFYVNRCGFQIVEFYNSHHSDPNEPEKQEETEKDFDGMFRFRKIMGSKQNV
jgi:GNAT superfamily N-acetyltransferase